MKQYIDFDMYMIEITLEDEPETYHMDFRVMEISARTQNPDTKEWDVPNYGTNCYSDDFEHGDEVVHGFIKWDGCSHWYFSEYQHLCGMQSIKLFGELPMKIYELAKANITRFSTDVAE